MIAGRTVRLLVLVFMVGCSKTERAVHDAIPEAAPPPRPAPAAPAAPKDAGRDARDAGSDAVDALPAAAGAKKPRASAPAAAQKGGSGAITGIQVQGSLARADAERLLRGRTAALRACYERDAQKNPNLHGRINFKLTLDDRGTVAVAEAVKSTLGGGDAELCMVRALQKLKFPPPPGGGEPSVTFSVAY